MAYVPNEACGNPVVLSFGGDTHTAKRAGIWDTGANKGKPKMPTSQLYDFISTADGEAAILAQIGLLVNIDLRLNAGQSVTADDLLQIDTTNGWLVATAGTAFQVKETVTNGGGSAITQTVQALVWKPRG